MKLKVSKSQAKRLVILVLPLYLDMFHQLKSARGGELVWPAFIVDHRRNVKADNYVDLYDDDKRLLGAMNLAIFSKADLKEIKEDIETKGIDVVQADFNYLFDEFLTLAEGFIKKVKDDPDSIEEPDEGESYTSEQIKHMQYMCISSLALYHNVFSIMVYGKRLAKLVQEAIDGDDESFLKAIKVDHSLIHHHTYFKERFSTAYQSQEVGFLKRVHEKQSAPSLTGRIKHRGLYTLFYFLDMLEVLDDFSSKDLFALYLDSDVTDFETPPYELSSFSEHLKKYKKNR